MAVDPRLGYDPAINAPRYAGAQTKAQWIADMTTSLTLRFLNGADMTEPEMADSWWASHGIPKLDTFGAAKGQAGQPNFVMDATTYNTMLKVANAMYTEKGVNLPDVAPLSPTDQTGITNATTQAAADKAAADRQKAADDAAAARATASDVAATERQRISEEGANSRNAATIASTDKNAAADRDAALARDTADNASKEKISAADRVESGRQFDITTAEGARQFNATSLMTLLDKGIQLAKNPVDWVAYQFYTKNLGIPMNALNMNALVTQLGAVPPSGPSAAGPFTGGAAAMFGDTTQAQAAGVQPQAVSVSQAVQSNPGDGGASINGGQPLLQHLTAATNYPAWVQAAGGAGQLEKQVADGRVNEVAPIAGDNPVTQQMRDYAQQIIAQTPPAPPASATGVPPPVPGQNAAPRPSWMNNSVVGSPDPDGSDGSQQAAPTSYQIQPAPVGGDRPMAAPQPATAQMPPPTGMSAPQIPQPGAPPPVPQSDPNAMQMPSMYLPNGQLNPNYHGEVYRAAPQPAVAPGFQVPNVTTGGSVGGAPGNASGIYTGPTQTHDAAVAPTGGVAVQPATATGVQAPAQNEMLSHLSQQLGMPYDQLAALVPPNLIAGGYSADTIAKTPVVQALNGSNDSLGYYHTDPTQTKFNTIQAFGTPVSFRGGQDINAQSYLNTTDANQQMLEGAVNATGQSWPDVQKQMLRASPLSNYDAGAFGRRVY